MASVSLETVAILVAVLQKNNVTLGSKEYKLMSALDGNKGENAFNHMFRPIKARAKEILAQLDDGTTPAPVVKARTPKKTPAAVDGGSKKRGRKAKSEPVGTQPADEDDEEEYTKTPSKKVKQEFEGGQLDINAEHYFEDALGQ